MAADILAYQAELVPAGKDQEPHIEVTREVARRMNKQFGTSFPETERFETKGEYVPSLTGEGKMSKSIKGSAISLTDSLQEIKEKVAGVPTDMGKGDKVPAKGGVAVLLKLVEMFEGEARKKEYEQAYTGEGLRYADLKKELSQAIYQDLQPIQQKREKLSAQENYLEEVIYSGAKKARRIAEQTLAETKEKMGLII
jgi:tryptophanyl-tRNA synthetase